MRWVVNATPRPFYPRERPVLIVRHWDSKIKLNVVGRSTSSHDSKKFRTRSVEKQGGMAFGFWKTATAVIKPDR
jgi:hypothetical protein